MTAALKQKFLDSLVPEEDLKRLINQRSKPYIFDSVEYELLEKRQKEGWEVEREYKTKVKIKKPKSPDHIFEDEIWTMMAKLGFKHLSKDRNFLIPYSTDGALTQQIDIFAADDETILIIECKASNDEIKKVTFKQAIEAIGGKKEGILKALKTIYPSSKYKVKFIFATKNYILSQQDQERMQNFGITHFDDDMIGYYQDLIKHLGGAAKYQLLGHIFEGQKIPGMQNKIPAIRGKMGGHTYYSFSIEPEKLLKIGYVLHRNKANKKLMPTYQRLIKKSRLGSVHEFIESDGYFPNSIIIDLDSNGKKVRFEPTEKQLEDSISKLGILHLPQYFRSAYIIDGQHRLYGYADSNYTQSNTIPVVAFVDLDRKEQLQLFMQINENQKAVPKNLRNTLNSDLLWSSDDLREQIKALKLQIAQDLGEEKSSPFYDRVIIGENPKTSTRCITIDTIKIGLDRSNFFGHFTKDSIKEDGTFYKGNNDETYDHIFPFLEDCFTYVKNNLPIEWDKGDAEDGFLSINPGVESLLRILSDIIDHLVASNVIRSKTDKIGDIVKEVTYYLDPLINYLENLSSEEKRELRKSYGTAGRAKYWRILQKAINSERSEFNPDGMSKYWKDEAKAFNEESFKMIRDLEIFMKDDFQRRLANHYGDNWFKAGLPKAVYDESIKRAADKNYEATNKADEVEPWDCLNMIDYRKIATYGRNWSEVFEKDYTKPGEEKIRGGKDAKTSWMQKLEKIRNQNFHSYSVKEEEYGFLLELNDWLIDQKVMSDL